MTLAKRAIKCLSGRKGFDHWWENIESDIQQEILAELDKELADANRYVSTADDEERMRQ